MVENSGLRTAGTNVERGAGVGKGVFGVDLTCGSGVAEQTPCWEVYHGDWATDKLLLLQ